jgi:transposase
MQAMGESYRKIAAEFSTMPSTVYAIVKRFKVNKRYKSSRARAG